MQVTSACCAESKTRWSSLAVISWALRVLWKEQYAFFSCSKDQKLDLTITMDFYIPEAIC